MAAWNADASADGVFVSSAWHWLDPGQAVPEIARVLRDGGRLGVIWTSRDRRVDWVAELDMLRRPHAVRSAEDARSQLRRRHDVTLPGTAPFENIVTASFAFVRTMTVDDAVDWVATYSGLITAPAEERAAGLARAREALLRRANADGVIEIPCSRPAGGPIACTVQHPARHRSEAARSPVRAWQGAEQISARSRSQRLNSTVASTRLVSTMSHSLRFPARAGKA